MTAFWLYAGLLFAAALAFILVPQLHLPRRRVDANRTRLNVGLYRERLRELETQHDTGTLDAVQLEAGRVEAARDLLDDAQGPEHAPNTGLAISVDDLEQSTARCSEVRFRRRGNPEQKAG